jgi:DNA-binding MarR family transcriptional regulator
MMKHISIETPATLKEALAQLEVDTTLSGAAKARRRTRMLQRLLALEGQAAVTDGTIPEAGPALAAATVPVVAAAVVTPAANGTEAPARRAKRRKPARSEEAPEAPAARAGKGKAAAGAEAKGEEGNETGRGGAAGLNGREIRVLTMLADEGPTEKGRLKKECGGTSAVLGAVTKEDLGKQGGGLVGKGLVTGGRKEGERQTVFSITPAGRKALTQAQKELAGK